MWGGVEFDPSGDANDCCRLAYNIAELRFLDVSKIALKMADPTFSPIPMDRDASPGSCVGCKQTIKDRYHLKILGQPWHVQCVKCHECQGLLNEKCFTRDFKLFCKADFYK